MKITTPEVRLSSSILQNIKGKTLEILFGLALFLAGIVAGIWLELWPAGFNFILLTAAYLLTGWRIIRQAGINISRGKFFDENFLMTVATLGAFALGEIPEAVTVMLFYRIGDYFQNRAVSYSKSSIRNLLEMNPDRAKIKTEEGIQEISADNLEIGDVAVISCGERIPADGKVVKGRANLDTSALTGESDPQPVAPGSQVKSGMLSLDGSLEVEIQQRSRDSAVARIIKLVEEAAARKGKTEKFITRIARYYTPLVMALAVLTALLPPLLAQGSWQTWFYRSLVFLVISCPCALVISIPLSFFGGIGASARQGILISGSHFIEKFAKIKRVIYDKTGTLTRGEFELAGIECFNDFAREDILRYLLAAEQYSSHPLARSLCENKNLRKELEEELPEVDYLEEKPGQGLEAKIEGEKILAGNRHWLEQDLGYDFPSSARGKAEILLVINDRPAALLYFTDALKSGAEKLITALKSAGITGQAILSGDNQHSVQEVASSLDLAYYSDLMPEDKLSLLEKFLEEGDAAIAYLGDGINDAPVLARADLGVAMGGFGSDAALEAADVVIMNDDPGQFLTGLNIARMTMRVVWQNIVLALGIKALIMLAGFLGFTNLWLAVFADVGVTILAVFNSLRIIWRYRQRGEHLD